MLDDRSLVSFAPEGQRPPFSLRRITLPPLRLTSAANRLVDENDRKLLRFFTIQIFSVIFLQKFAVPSGRLFISVPLIIFYFGLVGLALRGRVKITLGRALLTWVFIVLVLLSQALTDGLFSVPSLSELILLCIPLMICWTATPKFVEHVQDRYQDFMLIGAGMAYVQLAWELAAHGSTLSLQAIAPKALLMPGYIYEAPFNASGFIRPNGFFFLETSYVSAFSAVAAIIEATSRRRIWRFMFYALATFACMGATGQLMLEVAAPFLIARQRPKIRAWLIGAVLITVVVLATIAPFTGLADHLLPRLKELSQPQSSGYQRLVRPFEEIGNSIGNIHNIITGIGAGNADRPDESLWPFVKLLLEYGFFSAIFYVILWVFSIRACKNAGLSIAIFVMFQLTGGYLLNPVAMILVYITCTMIRPQSAELKSSPMLNRSELVPGFNPLDTSRE